MSESLFIFARDHFAGSIETSKSARLLLDQASLIHTNEEQLNLDFEGVKLKTLSATLILLRSVRRFLQASGARQALLLNLDPASRKLVDSALELRFDLSVVLDHEGVLYLAPRFPAEVIHAASGSLIKIGSARRKMAMVIERDGCQCAWCGKELSYDHPEATLDHVLPHSADGSQDWRNMILACKPCNSNRKHTSAKKWMKSCLEKGFEVNVQVVEAALFRLSAEPSLKRAFHRNRASQAA